ncbi:MAG: MarR family winged helix-turn-helix transcriptional regulator [Bacteroidales bacterium]|jgi:DNA-binding MarR family transcriptional regulator|nr:MarR family winged helix-turn-helix transcriptional regulator [Bacteroidales bacterium]
MNRCKASQYRQENVDNLIWRVIKLFIKHKRQILERFALTCPQYEILSALYYYSDNKTEIYQIDLSERTEIDPLTTSIILRGFQEKGLITLHHNSMDTHIVIVEFTETGVELFENVSKQMKKLTDHVYQGINMDRLIPQLIKLSDKFNNLI